MQHHTLWERILEPRCIIQNLARPRQVGKTTLVGQGLDVISIPYILKVADVVDSKDSDRIHHVSVLRCKYAKSRSACW